MATITIRDLPDGAKDSLRLQAAKAGVPLETYARHILQTAATKSVSRRRSVMDVAAKYFGGGNGVELELPDRGSRRATPEFLQ